MYILYVLFPTYGSAGIRISERQFLRSRSRAHIISRRWQKKRKLPPYSHQEPFPHPFPIGKWRREKVLDGRFVASICAIASALSLKRKERREANIQ